MHTSLRLYGAEGRSTAPSMSVHRPAADKQYNTVQVVCASRQRRLLGGSLSIYCVKCSTSRCDTSPASAPATDKMGRYPVMSDGTITSEIKFFSANHSFIHANLFKVELN